MQKNTHLNQHGFTLVELLLYIVILGTLLVPVSFFFATALDARIKNQSVSEVNDQAQAAMETITVTIRGANAISTPLPGVSTASLTLTVPTASLSPTVFSVQNGVLQVKEGSAAPVALTNGKVTVSGLSFKNLSISGTHGIVQVSFTIARVNPAGKAEYDYQKTFTTSMGLR